MIVINAKIHSDEASIAAMKDAIVAMVKASLEEEGCEDYNFSVEINDPTTIRITERWVSEDALKAHFATPHMAAFQKVMQANPHKGMELRCYEAEDIPFPAT
jgi:quinol monooxygenase YgiN